MEEENRKDDTNIQIITSLDGISSHEQTPVEATSAAASPHNENIGVNEITAEEHKNFLELDTYNAAFCDRWDKAQSIYEKFPAMVSTPLNASRDTALHIAVSENSSTFVKELVNRMIPRDLEIPNAEGKTAFYMAVLAGNDHLLQIMIEKNGNLPLIHGPGGILPVHLAASSGYHKIVQDLSSKNLLERMALKDIERLFFLTISSSMYDVATKLFEKYPALVISRDDQGLTALHMLARKNSEEFEASSGWLHNSSRLLEELLSEVIKLEYKHTVELITKPSVVLFDAVKSGNVKVVFRLVQMSRELSMIKDPNNNGQSLLHCAVLYRQRDIFNIIFEMKTVKHIIRDVDNDGNNILHFAAKLPEGTSSRLTSNIQMQREMGWFKEVEKKVPYELRIMRNKDDKTPEDIFRAKYENISEDVKDSAKTIAKAGMVVATLTATVAFAAALTVPGDKNDAGFIVFILSNAVALFCSSASIVSFMATFGSRFTEKEFIILLHPCVILGRWLLFISITAMIIAFAATSFLIFDHRYKWVAYVVTSMGLLPIILMLLVLQIPPLDSLLGYFFRSRYYDLSKKVQ